VVAPPEGDATYGAISAAEALLASLDDAQRAAISFDFNDDAQRAHGSKEHSRGQQRGARGGSSSPRTRTLFLYEIGDLDGSLQASHPRAARSRKRRWSG